MSIPFSGRGNCKVKLRNGSNVIDSFLQSGHLISERYWPASESTITESFLLR